MGATAAVRLLRSGPEGSGSKTQAERRATLPHLDGLQAAKLHRKWRFQNTIFYSEDARKMPLKYFGRVCPRFPRANYLNNRRDCRTFLRLGQRPSISASARCTERPYIMCTQCRPLCCTQDVREVYARCTGCVHLSQPASVGHSAAICPDGVDREISHSSSVMSSAIPSKSGVER